MKSFTRTDPERGRSMRRGRPNRRDDSGLTTLEWLLIVAAVAGLAALAVVLVTDVVSQTSEQISGTSARHTAAKLAAQKIQTDAAAATGSDATVNDEFGQKCRRLQILYGDVPGIQVEWTNKSATEAATCTVSVGSGS